MYDYAEVARAARLIGEFVKDHPPEPIGLQHGFTFDLQSVIEEAEKLRAASLADKNRWQVPVGDRVVSLTYIGSYDRFGVLASTFADLGGDE